MTDQLEQAVYEEQIVNSSEARRLAEEKLKHAEDIIKDLELNISKHEHMEMRLQKMLFDISSRIKLAAITMLQAGDGKVNIEREHWIKLSTLSVDADRMSKGKL